MSGRVCYISGLALRYKNVCIGYFNVYNCLTAGRICHLTQCIQHITVVIYI